MLANTNSSPLATCQYPKRNHKLHPKLQIAGLQVAAATLHKLTSRPARSQPTPKLKELVPEVSKALKLTAVVGTSQLIRRRRLHFSHVAASSGSLTLEMGMGRASVVVGALLVALAVLAPAVTATCNEELPPQLVGNYSGLACAPVWNSFFLRYAQDKDNVLRVVLSTMYSTGWVGMAFSSNGLMVGSSAMVGWMGKTGVAHIKQFALQGKTASQVVVDKGSLVSNDRDHTVLVQQAKIYLAFQLRFTEPLKRQNILLAFGSAIPVNNRLSEHQDKTSITFDFTTGSSSSASSSLEGLKRTHGALNLFAWGVLLPIGAIVARYCRRWDPLWFYLHAGIQFVGFILGLAGIVVGVSLYSKIQANVPAHRGLGIFVLVLGILQILAIFLRPNKDSKYRKFWNWYHHWVGRLALFFAAINIVVGIKVGGAGNSWKIGYGFNLGVLLITIITLEVLLWTKWRNNSSSTAAY